ncbi:hypothetical protein H7X46_06500 [Pseudonocardia sp. C8]|uniref:hypothetical protein n=1 Tax=Pseudonocardia sp. C8 TaxID=2762759 RepID=UPI001642CA65|nr:hypothetical protein [Pseudonocardia sp. C8]MBC3190707.1 hypothetical protein [Pseudonocardia sp. C8]
MSALPSPSGPTPGPQRRDPSSGSSRHSHRATTDPEPTEHDDPGGEAWFTVVLRGYDRSQVDARLADLDHRIHEEIRRAESAERALSDARAQIRHLHERLAAADASGSERRSTEDGIGRRVERVLQAAEEEATELRERASTEAAEIVARAREEAEERRTCTEEALLGRAATLDREFTSRSAALDEREDVIGRREGEVAERERAADERVSEAREKADALLAEARTDAEEILSAARDEAAALRREAERGVEERRTAVTRDIDRLAALRDEVRGELTRVRETLSTELDREPVAASLDDALFGSTAAPASASGGTSLVWSSGTTAGDRTSASPETGASLTDAGPSSDADSSASTEDDDDGEQPGDDDHGTTTTGTLLLGPGRRPGTERDDDPDRTTIGQIPPISLTSIGVLPFGDLGSGRDSGRTRTDGAGGASRGHRGPTRGPGAGRRSR